MSFIDCHVHVLPKGFVRIRFYGLLAPRCRANALPRCRQALHASPPPPVSAASTGETSTRVPLPPCRACGGLMIAVERLTVRQLAVQAFIDGLALDSS